MMLKVTTKASGIMDIRPKSVIYLAWGLLRRKSDKMTIPTRKRASPCHRECNKVHPKARINSDDKKVPRSIIAFPPPAF
jgi:hypothetical protein